MKKLKLTALDLGANGILDREELKKVKGGSVDAGCITCTHSNECGSTYYCANGCCFAA